MTDSPPNRPKLTERPTLKTIARLTGLAVPTVSRALNDAPDIGSDTKDRVRAVAKQIGYRPNRAGVRLRTGKTNVISLILSAEHDMMNHTARLITSIAATLHDTPYHMIITPYFATDDPMEPVRYVVETASADAVILNQTTPQDPRIAYLMEQGFPFATHGRTDWCARHAYFDFDNAAFGDIAVRDLAARGRRDILLVLPPMSQNYALDIHAGAVQTAESRGIRVHALGTATSDDPSAQIEEAVHAALCAAPQIDGIICAATTACMAATVAIERLGRSLGDDIDLLAKEAVPFLKRFRPRILTVKEDVTSAGEFIARAAMARIDDPAAAPMQGLDIPDRVA